jgi:sugar lactone lactonase YvrE
MARNLLKFYRGGFRLRHSLTILLALSLSLVPGAAFASSCEVGPATGVEPPLVTHLRAYPWTFRAPTRMALTADSSLLVSDPRRQHIVTREASGRIIDSHLHAGDPISVAVDAAGRVYVGDGDSGRVSVFSRNWEFLYDLGIGAGEFQLPVAIAVEPLDGRIYVVDSRSHEVKVFTPDGSPDFNFGGAGDGDGLFNFPAGIFVDAASAEVYVVDQLNYRVQVFDLQGGYLRCIGGTNANPGSFFGRKRPLNQPQGVWLDRAGRVLVSDAADGQVKVFDRNGNGLASIGEFGALPGGLRIPMDLAVDAHNRLFVAAANNSRLEVFGLDEYQDPEAVAPGVLDVDPAVLDRDALIDRLRVALELPGYRLDAIVPGSLQVNGIAPLSLDTGDADRDLIPDLIGQFDAAALAQTLPPSGAGQLRATALLSNGFQLEAQARVLILSTVSDSDGDGVDDVLDLCPQTSDGALIDADGCSVAQLCPCEGPVETGAWRNHGRYMVCTLRAVVRVGRHNELPRAQLRTLVPNAAGSACGKPPKQAKARGRRR